MLTREDCEKIIGTYMLSRERQVPLDEGMDLFKNGCRPVNWGKSNGGRTQMNESTKTIVLYKRTDFDGTLCPPDDNECIELLGVVQDHLKETNSWLMSKAEKIVMLEEQVKKLEEKNRHLTMCLTTVEAELNKRNTNPVTKLIDGLKDNFSMQTLLELFMEIQKVKANEPTRKD